MKLLKMKRPSTRALAVSAGLAVILTPGIAGAVDIGIPAAALLIPDICGSILGSGTCIQYTHAEMLVQIEQLLGVVQNLKAAGNIGGVISIVRGEIPQIEAAAATVAPAHAGSAAAATALAQVPAVDDQITAVGNDAVGCDGDVCVQQTIAAQATTTASEMTKANAMHVNEIKQGDAAQIGFANALIEEFGPAAHMPAELQ